MGEVRGETGNRVRVHALHRRTRVGTSPSTEKNGEILTENGSADAASAHPAHKVRSFAALKKPFTALKKPSAALKKPPTAQEKSFTAWQKPVALPKKHPPARKKPPSASEKPFLLRPARHDFE